MCNILARQTLLTHTIQVQLAIKLFVLRIRKQTDNTRAEISRFLDSR